MIAFLMTAGIETRIAEKSGPGTRRTDGKKLGLVWINRKKIIKHADWSRNSHGSSGNTIWLRNGFQRT
jgi:hypothetical protein